MQRPSILRIQTALSPRLQLPDGRRKRAAPMSFGPGPRDSPADNYAIRTFGEIHFYDEDLDRVRLFCDDLHVHVIP